MKPHEQGLLNRIGKRLARPLSSLVANPLTEDFATLFEAYWCILLGKGSGAGWGFDTEIVAARSVISSDAPVLFDVGANKGDWAIAMHAVFPRARMFLFEPQPKCQDVILQRKIPNTELVRSAVGAERQSAKLYTTGDTGGIASLYDRRDSYFQHEVFRTIDVHIVTLDDVISTNGLPAVDFMKMDIEGHELEALRGAAQSLGAGKIKALSFEFGSGNLNSRTFFHDFWDLLTPLGYEIYRILPSSRLMRIKDYYEDCEYFRGVSNYIAVLRGREAKQHS